VYIKPTDRRISPVVYRAVSGSSRSEGKVDTGEDLERGIHRKSCFIAHHWQRCMSTTVGKITCAVQAISSCSHDAASAKVVDEQMRYCGIGRTVGASGG
jgi:hypothetical protein